MRGVIKNRRAQVWIETVVYTLIAFVILGAVLSFAKPKIEQLQDKSIIEQSIKMMEDIDSTINSIKGVSGNKRGMDIVLKKGSLTIDGKNDLLIYEIESAYAYSEPGQPYQKGDIEIYTKGLSGKMNYINATLNYSGVYDITWTDQEQLKLLSKSSTPYGVFISNKGKENPGELNKINFEFK